MSQRSNQRVAQSDEKQDAGASPKPAKPEAANPRIVLVEGLREAKDQPATQGNKDHRMPGQKNTEESRPLNRRGEEEGAFAGGDAPPPSRNGRKSTGISKPDPPPQIVVAKLASQEDVAKLGDDLEEDGLQSVDLDNDGDNKQPQGKKPGSKNGAGSPAAAMSDDIDGELDTVDGPKYIKTPVEGADNASVYSIRMVKDFRYYFCHPYFRLFMAYFVVVMNFLIYAEDPVAHSIKECNIPVIGNDFAFVCTRYLPNAWSLLKVFLWLAGTIVGMIIGKIVFHTLLFNRLFRLKMFYNDKGSWMTMFLSTILFVFIFSYIYNAFLLIGGDYTIPYRISDLMGLSNSIFMKAAATGTWCGDFFTAWMVTDMMLQEKTLYPEWAGPVRRWWQRGKARIILFWIVVAVTSFIVIFIIATDYIQWDKLNHDLLRSNELSRAFLASFILVFDIVIVMQDWDFPHFISSIDIKLPGLDTAHINFKIPRPILKEFWEVHISGKWFNYGILFIVIILDLNMWKNQILYEPFAYGQYAGPQGRIYTVQDMESLLVFNETQLTFDFRNSTINPATNRTYLQDDSVMNARYYGYSLPVKGIAFIPGLAAFALLGILVWIYGRFKPTKDDPYAGRVVKHKKRRLSARKKWQNLRSAIRSRREAVVLRYFRRRPTNCGMDGTDGAADNDGGFKDENHTEDKV